MARARRNAGGRNRVQRIPERFQTYKVLAPLATHHRRATCVEVDCPNLTRARCENAGCTHFHTGWRTILPAGSPLLVTARASGRVFTEKQVGGGLVEFTFAPGQQCFASPHWAAGVGPCQVEHWVSLERPAIYRVSGAKKITFPRAELWVEHWAEHADRVNAQMEKLGG